jgi:hypothetical protein
VPVDSLFWASSQCDKSERTFNRFGGSSTTANQPWARLFTLRPTATSPRATRTPRSAFCFRER